MQYLISIVVGLISGITSGLFGVGGGVVMVPAMILLLGVDMKKAVGTSLAVIIPTAIVTTFKHYKQGNVEWGLSLSLAPAAIIGGYLGAWLTLHLKSSDLKRAFGLFLAAVGVYIFFSDKILPKKPAPPAALSPATPTNPG